MRVAINALSARAGAGMSMMESLLPEIARIDRSNTYIVFCHARQRELKNAIPAQFVKVEISFAPRNPFLRILWEQLIFPFYLLMYRADVLYSVGNTTAIFAPCKVVLLMENANPYSLIDLPWSRKEKVRLTLLRLLGWMSARRATKIRFVSENSKRLIAPQIRVSDEKCVVIPHGIPVERFMSTDGKEKRPHEKRNYILTIGVNTTHRNTARLIEAFSILVKQYNYSGDLIILGQVASVNYQIGLQNLVNDFDLRGRVFLEGEVPHYKIGAYFKGADAFVFPSVEETFGIPLLEAMACGVPVVASDCDLDFAHRGKCFNPFREICGEAAEYFNPFEPADIAKTAHRILNGMSCREILIKRGMERVNGFLLKNTAHSLVNLFYTVID